MNWIQNYSQKAMLVLKKPVVFSNYLRLKKGPILSEIVNIKPTHLVLYPTDKCNLRCSWCLRERAESKEIQHAKINDLDLQSFERILDRFPSLSSISFAGQGEFFLNDLAFDMIGLAGRRNLRVYITTHGLLLNDDRIERLMTSNVVQVNFSLKGKDPDEFADVTGTPASQFYKQLENIAKFVRAKKRSKSQVVIRVSYVVDRENYRNMGEVIDRMDALGVDRVLLDNLVPFHDLQTGSKSLFADNSEVVSYIQTLAKIPRRVSVDFPILLKREGFSFYCPGFYNVLNVDNNGNVSGCMRVLTPSPLYGNVFQNADVMNSPYFRQVRKLYLEKKMPDHCRTCVEMSKKHFQGQDL